MWVQLELPEIPGTIQACSVPINGESLAVWTNEGVFRVRLNQKPAVFKMLTPKDAVKKFDKEKGQFISHGNLYRMIGDCGEFGWREGDNLATKHTLGDQIVLDQENEEIRIVDVTETPILTIKNANVNDRFFVCCFGQLEHYSVKKYLIFCDSDLLRVYRHTPDTEIKKTKWSQSGSQATHRELLKAIIDDLDSDTPRLVYADWLDEHGDTERAQLIRIQCRIAQRERTDFVPPDDPDMLNSKKLISEHGERWIKEFNAVNGFSYRNFFCRGFPAVSIENLKWASSQKNQKHLLTSIPFDFLYYYNTLIDNWLLDWPAISHIRCLNIHSYSTQSLDSNIRVLSSHRLTNVRQLSFSGWYDQSMSQAIFKNKSLKQLEMIHFDFVSNGHGISEIINRIQDSRLHTVTFKSTGVNSLRLNSAEISRLSQSVKNVIHIVYREGRYDSWNKL